MKQLIKMSVVVLGVLCGSVNGMWRSTVNMNNAVSQMLVAMRANNAVLQTPAAGVNENNTASQAPVVNVDDAAWQLPAVDANTVFSEANNRIRRNVPIVHQYKIEDIPGGPDFRVSMRIDPTTLGGRIAAVNGICTPLNKAPLAGIQGVTPEFWITVISRRSIQSGGQRIQFRPQWVGFYSWKAGVTVLCPSTSHVCTFFNGGNEIREFSQRDLRPGDILQLHPADGDPNTMAVSPDCFNLPAQVQNGGSFAVVYHTVCQNINRDIYGIILVYDNADMASFNKTENDYVREQLQEIFPNAQGVEEELRQQVMDNARVAYRTRSVRDVFRNAPVIGNNPQLQAIF